MSDKKWVHAFVVGIGEVVFWADVDGAETVTQAGVALEVENLTQIMVTQQGLVPRPLASKIAIFANHVAAMGVASPDIAQRMTQVWDKGVNNGGIVLPTPDARRKLGLR